MEEQSAQEPAGVTAEERSVVHVADSGADPAPHCPRAKRRLLARALHAVSSRAAAVLDPHRLAHIGASGLRAVAPPLLRLLPPPAVAHIQHAAKVTKSELQAGTSLAVAVEHTARHEVQALAQQEPKLLVLGTAAACSACGATFAVASALLRAAAGPLHLRGPVSLLLNVLLPPQLPVALLAAYVTAVSLQAATTQAAAASPQAPPPSAQQPQESAIGMPELKGGAEDRVKEEEAQQAPLPEPQQAQQELQLPSASTVLTPEKQEGEGKALRAPHGKQQEPPPVLAGEGPQQQQRGRGQDQGRAQGRAGPQQRPAAPLRKQATSPPGRQESSPPQTPPAQQPLARTMSDPARLRRMSAPGGPGGHAHAGPAAAGSNTAAPTPELQQHLARRASICAGGISSSTAAGAGLTSPVYACTKSREGGCRVTYAAAAVTPAAAAAAAAAANGSDGDGALLQG